MCWWCTVMFWVRQISLPMLKFGSSVKSITQKCSITLNPETVALNHQSWPSSKNMWNTCLETISKALVWDELHEVQHQDNIHWYWHNMMYMYQHARTQCSTYVDADATNRFSEQNMILHHARCRGLISQDQKECSPPCPTTTAIMTVVTFTIATVLAISVTTITQCDG